MADLFYAFAKGASLGSLGPSKILFDVVSEWFDGPPTAVPPVEALSSTPQLLYVGGGITVIVIAFAFFQRRRRPRRSKKPFPTGIKLFHDAGDSIVE